MWDIQLFKLNFDNQEKNAVIDVIDSEWLTMGERTSKFEENFSKYHGKDVYATSTSNCTASLHMSLLALGIKDGDEVIIPALTFVADANVVRMAGAKPVLADCSSEDDWNVSAETINNCITPKTKAVIVVHFAGYTCNMPEIFKLCKEKNIKLIEDVAHAPGSSIGDKKSGTWGDVGCFSFFSNKNISVGEGGMAITKDADIHNKLQYLRSHGMTSLTFDRHKGRSISYDVTKPGLNYRIDEIRSALGIIQLSKLDEGNKRRKSLTELYRSELKDSKFSMPFSIRPNNEIASYHILPILLPEDFKREDVINYLKSNKIQSSIHYPAFWEFSAFKKDFNKTDTPITNIITKRQLTLPLYPTMSDNDVKKVCRTLLKYK